MSKPNGKPISPAEVTLQPTYDMSLGDEVSLPKIREKTYPKFTEKNRREILLILKGGLSLETAAGKCRVSPRTIEHWLSIGEQASDDAEGMNGEFRTFYLDSLEATSTGILGMRALLQDWALRDASTAKWIAERNYPREFGKPTERITHTGKDGGPIDVVIRPDLSKLSNEELDNAIYLQEKGTEDIIDAEIVEKD